MKNSSLLTLDRLRLAVTRNETAKKRAGGFDSAETVDAVAAAAFRRDVIATR